MNHNFHRIKRGNEYILVNKKEHFDIFLSLTLFIHAFYLCIIDNPVSAVVNAN